MNCRPLLVAALLLSAGTTLAQGPVHYQHRADDPPGLVGAQQLQRGGPLAGYFQPVEVRGPKKSLLSVSTEGTFTPGQSNKALVGMLVGEVYRLRIGNIPDMPDQEVFPSIEIINRLYPPPGQETRFPIPIEITQEDIEFALAGKYVTRVIYLEDPRHPLPVREIEEQRVVDSKLSQDPLQVADQLGRPMAILRLGSRVPDVDPTTGRFLFNSPSLQIYEQPLPVTSRNSGIERPAVPAAEGAERTGRYPRR